MSLNRNQKGFTIVELLIVIVVIGILAALVITTFTGIQQKGRNTERTTDIKALHSQLEAFYAKEGYYPDSTDMNSATWRAANLKGLDQEALRDPRAPAGTFTLPTTDTTDRYMYAVYQAGTGTNACTTADKNCGKYTLSANLEGESDYVKESLNN